VSALRELKSRRSSEGIVFYLNGVELIHGYKIKKNLAYIQKNESLEHSRKIKNRVFTVYIYGSIYAIAYIWWLILEIWRPHQYVYVYGVFKISSPAVFAIICLRIFPWRYHGIQLAANCLATVILLLFVVLSSPFTTGTGIIDSSKRPMRIPLSFAQ